MRGATVVLVLGASALGAVVSRQPASIAALQSATMAEDLTRGSVKHLMVHLGSGLPLMAGTGGS